MRTRARTALSILSGAVLLAGDGLLARPAGAQAAPSAQAPATAPAAAPSQRFPAAAEVVALDLVVRDKKGKLVTDLRQEEVEVLEDGVPQKLTSFRARSSRAPRPAARRRSRRRAGTRRGVAPRARVPAPRPRRRRRCRPRHVVLVFGRLGSDGRRLAQSAGEEFARKHVTPRRRS